MKNKICSYSPLKKVPIFLLLCVISVSFTLVTPLIGGNCQKIDCLLTQFLSLSLLIQVTLIITILIIVVSLYFILAKSKS